jgi:hypothetical protein
VHLLDLVRQGLELGVESAPVAEELEGAADGDGLHRSVERLHLETHLPILGTGAEQGQNGSLLAGEARRGDEESAERIGSKIAWAVETLQNDGFSLLEQNGGGKVLPASLHLRPFCRAPRLPTHCPTNPF